jgi:hypothetical protein
MNARKHALLAPHEREVGLQDVQLARSISNKYRHPTIGKGGIRRERLVSVEAAVGGNDLMRIGANAVPLPPDVDAERAMRQKRNDCRNSVGCGSNHRLERTGRFLGDLRGEADGKEVGKVGAIDDAEIDPSLVPIRDRVGGRFERVDPQPQCKTISGTGGHDA